MRRLLFCAIALTAALPCRADAPSGIADAETDRPIITLEEAARWPGPLGRARLEELARCLRPMDRTDRRYWLDRIAFPRQERCRAAFRALADARVRAHLRKQEVARTLEDDARAALAAMEEVSALEKMLGPPPPRRQRPN
jgi:hypothetical protein